MAEINSNLDGIVEVPKSLQQQVVDESLTHAQNLATSEDDQVKKALSAAQMQIAEWNSWRSQGLIDTAQFDQLAASAIAEARVSTTIDSLTGLLNGSGMTARIQELISRAHRTHEPLGVLFIDLEGFKLVNDTLGHKAGDKILQLTAEFLRQTVRGSDPVARFGGDEFVVGVLESRSVNRKLANGEQRETARERITREIQGNYSAFVNDRLGESGIPTGSVHIGARIGSAQYQKEEDVHTFIKRADMDMNSKRDPNKPGRQ